MSTEDEQEPNIFIRRSVYPEAEGIFSFRPKRLEEIKDECLVVLDTNSLLVPYTTGKNSLEQISKIYRRLVTAKRLVVPGQVAREFAEHRVTKLKELYQQISRKQAKLGLGNYPLLDNLSEYQKAHELEKQLSDSLREYNETITAILDIVGNWYWDDPVSALYGDLFAADVVVDPDFDDKEIRKRLEKDILYKLPPGYKDAGKDDEGIGDLLIWQTILDLSRVHKKSVIFVSLDKKADWLSQSEGRPLYPRYELVDEFRRASSGQSFHILKFSTFLDLFGATEDVVEEVRKEEMQSIIDSAFHHDVTRRYLMVEQAVFKWLWQQYPERVSVADIGDRVDLIIANADGSRIGVEVKYFRDSKPVRFRLKHLWEQFRRGFAQEKYRSLIVAIVCEDEETLLRVTSYLSDGGIPISDVTVTVGYLGDGGEFKPIRSISS
jgi:rRNA-processing protein FCF1